MNIQRGAMAGTLESSDILIRLEPTEGEAIEISLQSPVAARYGGEIRRTILSTLEEVGVTGARVIAVDQGALDCAIRARVLAAAARAMNEGGGST